MNHKQASALSVSVKKMEEFGLSLDQIAVALLLIVLGFVTYYVCPLSWLLNQKRLFFTIMNSLLMMTIIGMNILSIAIFPIIAKFVLNILLFFNWNDFRKLRPVILKNMEANKNRNTKTAIMFSMCLAFMMFGGSFS